MMLPVSLLQQNCFFVNGKLEGMLFACQAVKIGSFCIFSTFLTA